MVGSKHHIGVGSGICASVSYFMMSNTQSSQRNTQLFWSYEVWRSMWSYSQYLELLDMESYLELYGIIRYEEEVWGVM